MANSKRIWHCPKCGKKMTKDGHCTKCRGRYSGSTGIVSVPPYGEPYKTEYRFTYDETNEVD